MKVKTLIQNLKTEFHASLIMFVVVMTYVTIHRQIIIQPKIILLSNILLGIITYLVAAKIINTKIFSEIKEMVWNKSGR